VTATALLYSYLKQRNADCVYYIPDRFDEGYGMNSEAVKNLHNQGVEFIVTVDNGISCIDEIKLANSLGMTVVVTDHHLPGDIIPNAAAVVDPHRKDCPSAFKSICGAEVAFKLICVMEGKEPEELLPIYADILAVAVIADIMPLTFENRIIVKYGVEKLKKSPLTGLSALLQVAGVSYDNINASRVAFGICPRLNAAGRMGKAERAVELLCSSNMLEALKIADEIDKENSLRQQIEKNIFEQAVLKIEQNNYQYDRVIVVEGEGWHNGVVGIVASRICERYGAPCIVISCDGDMAHGSGRSFEDFSLYDAIYSCKDLLTKFGGHSQAAGVSIRTEDIVEFRNSINDYAQKLEIKAPILKIDCRLNPSALTIDLSESIKQLEPFGFGNPVPLFGLFGVTLNRITPVANNKHLKLLFTKGENTFQTILFGMSDNDFCFNVGDLLDLAVTVETNVYNGNATISVQIKAIRISGTDDNKLFKDVANFNNFMSGKEYNVKDLTPTREEVGNVYRLISQKAILKERLKYIFINDLGYAKTMISLITLEELGLIKQNGNKYYADNNAVKTNLLNSKTYNFLTKECEK
jgi:single-stranded-DNA-specific exonuclease